MLDAMLQFVFRSIFKIVIDSGYVALVLGKRNHVGRNWINVWHRNPLFVKHFLTGTPKLLDTPTSERCDNMALPFCFSFFFKALCLFLVDIASYSVWLLSFHLFLGRSLLLLSISEYWVVSCNSDYSVLWYSANVVILFLRSILYPRICFIYIAYSSNRIFSCSVS